MTDQRPDRFLRMRLLVPAVAACAILGAANVGAAPLPAADDADGRTDTAIDTVETAEERHRKSDFGCVRETGSRLRHKPCRAGRVFDAEDIRATGAHDIAEALRLLDPSIRIHGR